MAGVPLVAAMSPYSAPVHINVGGTTFTSSLETLTKFPHSKLAKLFNGTLPVAVDPVKQRYFLDRDGKMFRHILNFLRNSEMVLPDTFSEFNLLKKEAAYFEIKDLLLDIDRFLDGEPGADDCSEKQQHGKKRKKKKAIMKKKQVSNTPQVVNEISEIVHAAVEPTLKQETNKDIECASLSTHNGVTNDVPKTNNSPLDKFSKDKETVCVITDCKGKVQELWCSNGSFGETFNDNKEFLERILCTLSEKTDIFQYDFLGSSRITFPTNMVCRRCSYDCSWAFISEDGYQGCLNCSKEFQVKIHSNYHDGIYNDDWDDYLRFQYKLGESIAFGFPWIATYLFKRGFSLSTSVFDKSQYNYLFVK